MLQKNSPIRFMLVFVALFAAFYYFNIGYFAITSPGKHYIAFLDEHLNYIRWLRVFLIEASAWVMHLLGYKTVTNQYEMLTVGRGILKMVYSCLGLGVMSFFAAFVIAYPKPLKNKIGFGISGLVIIQVLNIGRFVLLALYWNKSAAEIIDHHTIFNAIIYLLISITLYFWVTHDSKRVHAKN